MRKPDKWQVDCKTPEMYKFLLDLGKSKGWKPSVYAEYHKSDGILWLAEVCQYEIYGYPDYVHGIPIVSIEDAVEYLSKGPNASEPQSETQRSKTMTDRWQVDCGNVEVARGLAKLARAVGWIRSDDEEWRNWNYTCLIGTKNSIVGMRTVVDHGCSTVTVSEAIERLMQGPPPPPIRIARRKLVFHENGDITVDCGTRIKSDKVERIIARREETMEKKLQELENE